MTKSRCSRKIATVSHVGMDVPDEIAFPLIMQRIMAKTIRTASGCWQWTGYVLPSGYAEISFRSKQCRVHRLMYEAANGPIPDGMDVLHSCDNTLCFNPAHLSLGTDSENITQSVERKRHAKSRNTCCPAGHSFAEHGWINPRTGWRACKACNRIKYRLKAGWPIELANAERRRGGRSPISNSAWRLTRVPRTRVIKTHCIRDHELSGDNLYVTPDGRRQCRQCHHDAVKRFRPKPAAHYAAGVGKP